MSLRRKLAIIALLYVIEGFPMGVFRDFWSVVLRREGMALAEIGLVSGLGLAWSLKVFWSPVVDRFSEQRRWISGCLLVMSAGLVIGAHADASRLGPLLWVALGAFCLASATQDIAIDAYTIGLVSPGQEGPANSMRITAYRVGMILAGALLILSDQVGYVGAFYTAACGTLAMAAGVFVCPRVQPLAREREATFTALWRWLDRPGVSAVFGFVLLFRVGDLAMGPMVRPFWVDAGFSDSEIGVVTNIVGILVFVVGALIGGLVVARVGIARSLWVLGALALASNLAYALAALQPEPGRVAVYAASVAESLCAGLASNAFMSFLMHICEKRHAAVSYALLTALYALPGVLAGAASGWITEQVGYAAYFALSGALALPAFALLPSASRWIRGA